jgi:hypothetical protein
MSHHLLASARPPSGARRQPMPRRRPLSSAAGLPGAGGVPATTGGCRRATGPPASIRRPSLGPHRFATEAGPPSRRALPIRLRPRAASRSRNCRSSTDAPPASGTPPLPDPPSRQRIGLQAGTPRAELLRAHAAHADPPEPPSGDRASQSAGKPVSPAMRGGSLHASRALRRAKGSSLHQHPACRAEPGRTDKPYCRQPRRIRASSARPACGRPSCPTSRSGRCIADRRRKPGPCGP